MADWPFATFSAPSLSWRNSAAFTRKRFVVSKPSRSTSSVPATTSKVTVGESESWRRSWRRWKRKTSFWSGGDDERRPEPTREDFESGYRLRAQRRSLVAFRQMKCDPSSIDWFLSVGSTTFPSSRRLFFRMTILRFLLVLFTSYLYMHFTCHDYWSIDRYLFIISGLFCLPMSLFVIKEKLLINVQHVFENIFI